MCAGDGVEVADAQPARLEELFMKIAEGEYSLAEIVDWFRSRELVANNEYQRGGGLWPAQAKSYFIDTILKGFPFPKVYFHERLDKKTKRPRREIVDGQQRLSTIVDFADDKFALGANARNLEGLRFSDLPEEMQDEFWSYTVSVDVIRNADRSEILQMFRRMNAYTLPLNESEKRHSEFFGNFKDWVNSFLDGNGRILTDWEVLTSRQIMRMADAEFVADLALAIDEGIVSTSPKKLRDLYARNDVAPTKVFIFDERLSAVFNVAAEVFSPLRETYITKTHVFHSFLCAMLHNKWGLPDAESDLGIAPIEEFFVNAEAAVSSLKRLSTAHEEKELGEFGEYVRAASEGGNRAAQRIVRVKWLARALRGEFA